MRGLVVAAAVDGDAREAERQEAVGVAVVGDVFVNPEVLEIKRGGASRAGLGRQHVTQGYFSLEAGVHQFIPRRLRVARDCCRRRRVRCSPCVAPCWAACAIPVRNWSAVT